jgi:hypothetical protein
MEEEKTACAQAIISGTLKDYAEYKSVCGKISGLNIAQRIVSELRIRLKQQDD